MLVNWRGFEAYRAYVAFVNSSIPQQLVGRGWGATVDIGFGVQMSEDLYYRYLPILHNGYMQILTKYGLLGIFLYLVFLWRVTIGSRKYFIENNNATYARFITGLGFVLVYTSLVITGILNKGNLDSVLLVLGLFFGSASLPLNNRLVNN
jgi:O-antigen ligase